MGLGGRHIQVESTLFAWGGQFHSLPKGYKIPKVCVKGAMEHFYLPRECSLSTPGNPVCPLRMVVPDDFGGDAAGKQEAKNLRTMSHFMADLEQGVLDAAKENQDDELLQVS